MTMLFLCESVDIIVDYVFYFNVVSAYYENICFVRVKCFRNTNLKLLNVNRLHCRFCIICLIN